MSYLGIFRLTFKKKTIVIFEAFYNFSKQKFRAWLKIFKCETKTAFFGCFNQKFWKTFHIWNQHSYFSKCKVLCKTKKYWNFYTGIWRKLFSYLKWALWSLLKLKVSCKTKKLKFETKIHVTWVGYNLKKLLPYLKSVLSNLPKQM